VDDIIEEIFNPYWRGDRLGEAAGTTTAEGLTKNSDIEITASLKPNITPPGVRVGEAAAFATVTALTTTMGPQNTASATTNNIPQPPTTVETKSTSATTKLNHYQHCHNDFQPKFHCLE
jgi:hypothetical protein